ncbi:hypothetical protein ACFX13_038992 [Malus domestica]
MIGKSTELNCLSNNGRNPSLLDRTPPLPDKKREALASSSDTHEIPIPTPRLMIPMLTTIPCPSPPPPPWSSLPLRLIF